MSVFLGCSFSNVLTKESRFSLGLLSVSIGIFGVVGFSSNLTYMRQK